MVNQGRKKKGSKYTLYGNFCLSIRFFLTIVSTYRFLSETVKDAKGSGFGERISERAKVWKSLSPEERSVV